MNSRYLSRLQLHALARLGDAYLPGDQEFPSFRRLGCIEHVDRILEHTPPSDLQDLKMVLSILFFFPKWTLILLIHCLHALRNLPGPAGNLVRAMGFGFKALTMSLYYSGLKGSSYSGKTPLELLDYEVQVYRGDCL